MQVLLFLHRLYFFVILNIRNKKTYKMKKIIFLFIISSLISIKGIGLTLSPETEVSILTCAPGNELYSLFGHTAVSYTHLDVYKRQPTGRLSGSRE